MQKGSVALKFMSFCNITGCDKTLTQRMLSSTIISVTTEVVCGEPQRVITQYLTEFEEDRCGTLRVTFRETSIVANMM